MKFRFLSEIRGSIAAPAVKFVLYADSSRDIGPRVTDVYGPPAKCEVEQVSGQTDDSWLERQLRRKQRCICNLSL
jgi:hypothetical protein